jgi:phytoene dehydrogenase-like protein
MAGSGIIGTALGVYSPGTAYVLLHHYMGDVDGNVGAWGFARGGMGAIANALSQRRSSPMAVRLSVMPMSMKSLSKTAAHWCRIKRRHRVQAPIVVSNLDPKRTFLDITNPSDLPKDVLEESPQFQNSGLVRKAEYRAGWPARVSTVSIHAIG